MATIKLKDYLLSLSSKGSSANNDKITILDSADGNKIKSILKSDLVDLTYIVEELRDDFLDTLGDNVISSSAQVNADTITNFDANVKAKINSDGVLSGSSQVTLGGFDTDNLSEGSSNLYYTNVRVKTKLNAESVISSSAQIDGEFLNTTGDDVVSSSIQITITDTTGFTTLSSSLQSTDNAISARVTAVESFSSSLDSTYASDSELTAVSSALDSTDNAIAARVTAVESFSSSLDSTYASDSELTAVSSAFDSTINSLNTADVSEDSSNKYYTDVRVKTKLTAEDVVSGSNSNVKTFLAISASDISDVEAFSQSGTYSGLRAQSTTAADVDLGNVTNESKATMFTSPAFTTNPTAPTQTGTDDSTKLATTQFVQARITNIIGNAGSTLDTLGELSASLAEDSGSLSTLTTTVGTKLAKASNLSDLQDAATARTNLGVDAAGTVNYVLPTNLAGDDIDIDTTPLTGATVISDLDINITTNTSGLVTDANGTVATRTLTATDLSLGNVTNESKATMFTDPTFTGTVGGTTDFGGNVSLTGSLNVKGDIMPSAENLYDIGSAAMRWEDMWADQVYGRSVYVDDYIYHNGDADTYIAFAADRQTYLAGAAEFIDFRETTQSYLTLGNGNDTDTKIQGGAGYIFIQGSDGYIGINDATPSYPFEVNGNTYIGGTLGVSGNINGNSLSIGTGSADYIIHAKGTGLTNRIRLEEGTTQNQLTLIDVTGVDDELAAFGFGGSTFIGDLYKNRALVLANNNLDGVSIISTSPTGSIIFGVGASPTKANSERARVSAEGIHITGSLGISGDGSNGATLTESGNGDFDIVSVDDLRLTAGGNDIVLKGNNGDEYGRLSNDSQNLIIKNITSDKDISFVGKDDATDITALTLDMSNGGSATFRDDIDLGGKLTQTGTGTNKFGGKIGIGINPVALLHITGSGDAIRVESTNASAGGAQIDLFQFSSSPNTGDAHGVINFGGYWNFNEDSATASSIKSIWSENMSDKKGELQFWVRDNTTFESNVSIKGGGIVFGGNTVTGNKTSVDLDYYEEGTWTPTITNANGTLVVAGYDGTGSPAGQYTRVGRMVTLFLQFEITDLDGASSGALVIQGMPFNCTLAGGVGGQGVIPTTGKTLNIARYNDTTLNSYQADGSFAGTGTHPTSFVIHYNV